MEYGRNECAYTRVSPDPRVQFMWIKLQAELPLRPFQCLSLLDGNLLLLPQFNVPAISWWKKRERKVWMGVYSFMFQTVHAHTFAKSHTPCPSTMKSMLSVFLSMHSVQQCQRLLVIKRHILFRNFWYWGYHSAAFVFWCSCSFSLCSVAIKDFFFAGFFFITLSLSDGNFLFIFCFCSLPFCVSAHISSHICCQVYSHLH